MQPRRDESAPAPSWGATLTLLAALAAAVAPALAQGPTPAVLAALALVLAATATLATLLPRHAEPLLAVTPHTSYDDGATLRGRVGDPVHHPRRPRAPGAR